MSMWSRATLGDGRHMVHGHVAEGEVNLAPEANTFLRPVEFVLTGPVVRELAEVRPMRGFRAVDDLPE